MVYFHGSRIIVLHKDVVMLFSVIHSSNELMKPCDPSCSNIDSIVLSNNQCRDGEGTESLLNQRQYGRCLGSADDAYRAFCEIKFRNLVSWNSIISVYCQRGDAVFAYKLFSNMQKDGQMPSRVSKAGFLQDLYVGSALVSGLARVGLVDYARKIFEQMGERNVVLMNGLMVGLVRQK
ncbi:putative pentatricopeptide [Rosa chinensis]|uniref:Putative pentatricopeptide n=1 Tax=Rosa chinensis TaxID=74649 RepID=A0A2P6S1D6_ROSCH|nr:putative pentatricopeptide [Rosa chinensis]